MLLTTGVVQQGSLRPCLVHLTPPPRLLCRSNSHGPRTVPKENAVGHTCDTCYSGKVRFSTNIKTFFQLNIWVYSSFKVILLNAKMLACDDRDITQTRRNAKYGKCDEQKNCGCYFTFSSTSEWLLNGKHDCHFQLLRKKNPQEKSHNTIVFLPSV